MATSGQFTERLAAVARRGDYGAVSSHDDITPRYLPNGNIAFISTRRGGYSRCGPDFAPCHTLALADADGANQRLISFHEVHEYDPAVTNDGRIVYDGPPENLDNETLGEIYKGGEE